MSISKYYYNDGTISSFKYRDKILHREDGPAIEWADGDKSWWVNGRRHRLDGPAFGSNSWYIKGMFYSKSCHNRLYLFSVLEPRRIDINSTVEN
jgi:hypothetical protein